MPRRRRPPRLAFRADVRLPPAPRVTPIYTAGVLLVVAQILGLYALVTRKADFIFAVTMAVILVVAVVLGGYGVYHRLH